MESPNMYDQQQLHQVDLKPKIMSPTSSTPVPTNANSNGNNSSNNNNNSNMQVNHNQQQQLVNGVSKVAVSKATVHQQYAEHCAAAGELTDLNNPEMTLDLQQLIDESSPFVNDAGILEILGNGLKHHQRPQPHTANQSYNPRSTLAYMPQPVHSAAGYQPPHHHQQQHQQHDPNSNSANNNNSCSDSNSSCSESPSIKEEPVDATDFRRHCQQQQQQQGYAQVQYPAFQQFAQALPPLHQTANPHLQQIQQQHNQQGRPGGQKLGAGLVGAGQQVARKQSKSVDKASDEYRRRRERNNIAVRKSREKAKVRTRETEERVKILMKDNDSLRKKVVELNEEVSVLKSLFHNVGMLPEQLQRELSRHLDQFQTHGQAI